MSANNDPRLNARLSVRRGLPGMMDIGKSAATGIQATMGLKAMIAKASQDVLALKISIQSLSLVGKIINPKSKDWTLSFDKLRDEVGDREPVYLALWKARRQCILISLVPEDIKPKEKMLYSGTRGAVKDAIIEVDDGCELEEFNVNERAEISYERYAKKHAAPKPYTEHEILRQEHNAAETGGGYGFLAHMAKLQAAEAGKGPPQMPVALPGLADLSKAMPSRLSRIPPQFKTDKEVSDEIKELSKTEKAKPVKLPGMGMGMALPGMAKINKQPEPEKKIEPEEEEEEPKEGPKEEEEDDEPEEDEDEPEEEEEEEPDEGEEQPEKEEEKPQPAPARSRRRGPRQLTEPVKQAGIQRRSSFNKVKNFFGFGKKKEDSRVFTEEELKQYPDDDGIATYMELLQRKKKKDYDAYDPGMLETYLSSREFFTIFEMSKETFVTLPAWRRNKLKKSAKLF
mmetsp:Transcript_15722/g.19496  ORF Transcript_15722/g.19496 Transcript_15722/m.19496 type:complete len:456 (-) Transcript_15722:732-2099(-)|eukprot:CAMPEP_0204840636 /NCGR_PEP_ID=MMETSP1346-20131115/38326_1 /ASSEMBLY_ACC=CAM_ASM_000771 /TAXON_ID=215587 /ORGANISM="Aplanochytrium stocchinoi, Strain GSBS06" /LENGTH=455 /DNA_ID=CAMNT_0051978155 /DNA_START=373 /DNA_END=1740 /DNA_ORIENTATION=-